MFVFEFFELEEFVSRAKLTNANKRHCGSALCLTSFASLGSLPADCTVDMGSSKLGNMPHMITHVPRRYVYYQHKHHLCTHTQLSPQRQSTPCNFPCAGTQREQRLKAAKSAL